MPETTAETATTDAPATEAPAQTETVDWQAEAEKWKAQARKNEERAKTNATAAKELETLRASTMTEQEKAVTEARDAGRLEAFAEASVELVDLGTDPFVAVLPRREPYASTTSISMREIADRCPSDSAISRLIAASILVDSQ